MMKARVTEEGVNIPKRMLEGAEEVDIREEPGGILVVPLKSGETMDRTKLGQGRRMADALEQLAASGGASIGSDPASWEREVRRDRSLPGRNLR